MLYKEIIESGEYKSVEELSSEYNIIRWNIDNAIKSGLVEFVKNDEFCQKKGRKKYFVKVESFKKWFEAFRLLYPTKNIRNKTEISDNEEIKRG